MWLNTRCTKEVLDSFYELTPTESDALKAIRAAKVAACIKRMGYKWLLSKPMPRIR